MIFFLGDLLFSIAAGAVLVCIAYVVFPWTAHLSFRELPAAFWALLSGRQARRRLLFLLKARRDADRDLAASLPKGELGIVIGARQVYAGLAIAWQWMTAHLAGGSRCAALREMTAAQDGMSAAVAQAVAGVASLDAAVREMHLAVTAASLPGMRYCQCTGCEAGRARAGHDRYERDFADVIRDKRAGRFL